MNVDRGHFAVFIVGVVVGASSIIIALSLLMGLL